MTYQEDITKEILEGHKDNALSMIIKENTGTSMLDSGGESNRRWQRLADVTLINEPESKLEISNDENLIISKSLFHFFNAFLDINEVSKQMEQDLWNDINNNKESYRDNVEEWRKAIVKNGFIFYDEEEDESYKIDLECESHGYTYNYEHLLNGNWLYTLFVDHTGGHEYLIIQTHNGADARGGFSSPHVFFIQNWDCFNDMLLCSVSYCINVWNKELDKYVLYDVDGGYGLHTDEELVEDVDEEGLCKLIIDNIFGKDNEIDLNNINIEEDICDAYESEHYNSKSFWIVGDLDGCNVTPKDKIKEVD